MAEIGPQYQSSTEGCLASRWPSERPSFRWLCQCMSGLESQCVTFCGHYCFTANTGRGEKSQELLIVEVQVNATQQQSTRIHTDVTSSPAGLLLRLEAAAPPSYPSNCDASLHGETRKTCSNHSFWRDLLTTTDVLTDQSTPPSVMSITDCRSDPLRYGCLDCHIQPCTTCARP